MPHQNVNRERNVTRRTEERLLQRKLANRGFGEGQGPSTIKPRKLAKIEARVARRAPGRIAPRLQHPVVPDEPVPPPAGQPPAVQPTTPQAQPQTLPPPQAAVVPTPSPGDLPTLAEQTTGVTEQGDVFEFGLEPELDTRLDTLLGDVGLPDDPFADELKSAIGQIATTDPQANPEVVLNRLANVREQMIPLREASRQRALADLSRMGLADSPQIVARTLGEIEQNIQAQTIQAWRDIVNDELARSGQRQLTGLQLGQTAVQSDRAFLQNAQQLGLQRGALESGERLDIARIANDARTVFNSGRAIDADIALRNISQNLQFQQFLHSVGMDQANFQFMVEQARIGNSFQLQQLLLQYMQNVSGGFI